MHQNIMSFFHTPDSYPIDARGCGYTIALFSAEHVGQAQHYLMATHDRDGQPLVGDPSQRLRVPANAPVTQYWSMTVYNRDTHTFFRNASWMGRSRRHQGCTSTPTVRSTSTSERMPLARSRIGCPPIATV